MILRFTPHTYKAVTRKSRKNRKNRKKNSHYKDCCIIESVHALLLKRLILRGLFLRGIFKIVFSRVLFSRVLFSKNNYVHPPSHDLEPVFSRERFHRYNLSNLRPAVIGLVLISGQLVHYPVYLNEP